MQKLQEFRETVIRFSEYGRASLLFQNIVQGDNKDSLWFSDSNRIKNIEDQINYSFSDNVKNYVLTQLRSNRAERLRCVYFNHDKENLIKKVLQEISLNCARAGNERNLFDRGDG